MESYLKPPYLKRQQLAKGAKTRAWAALFAGASSIFILLSLLLLVLPKSLNPLIPLHPQDDMGPMTKWKLQSLAADPVACRQFLKLAGVTFTEVPDRSDQNFCHVRNALRMTHGGPPLYPKSPVMACPVAAGLIVWHRHGLDPAAQATLGSPISRIDHLGTYNCRRQYGRATGRVSEHASANAIDIASFRLVDGTRISVLKDWDSATVEPKSAAAFLRSAQSRACGIFKVVLGPQANAAHRDHFHFDFGPMSSCR